MQKRYWEPINALVLSAKSVGSEHHPQLVAFHLIYQHPRASEFELHNDQLEDTFIEVLLHKTGMRKAKLTAAWKNKEKWFNTLLRRAGVKRTEIKADFHAINRKLQEELRASKFREN